MNKRVLVTGATGFAGSHILMQLQAAGLTAIAACRDPARLPPGFAGEARVGDLRDRDYLGRVLDGIDVVCHAAGWPSLWGNATESEALFLRPSLMLLDACEAAGVGRFVFLSTTSAASPDTDGDAMKPGIRRAFWPYQCAVVDIEDELRARARDGFSCVNLRCGLFAGERYGLGLLPILLPRLKTRLVPWIDGGRTGMPIIDGSDIGRAFVGAVNATGLQGYTAVNIVGPEIPSARKVLEFLNREFGYPVPWFSVPFPAGYAFARLMEWLDVVFPWQPLVVRSIIHLLEETGADNRRAERLLGYRPQVHWQDAIRSQVAEMRTRQHRPMPMAMPIRR